MSNRDLHQPAFRTTAILDELRRIVRVLRQSSRAAERSVGVSGAQLFVLQALSTEKAISLNELAALTRTHQSTVSVVVKRLVEHGYVSRGPSLEDARRLELSLTRSGRALLAKAPDAAQGKLILGIEALSPRRQILLAEALRDVLTAMKLEHEEPVMFFDETASSTPAARPQQRRQAGTSKRVSARARKAGGTRKERS